MTRTNQRRYTTAPISNAPNFRGWADYLAKSDIEGRRTFDQKIDSVSAHEFLRDRRNNDITKAVA